MNMVFTPGPIHGIDPHKSIPEYTLQELYSVWGEFNRNRDPLQVIALIEGQRQSEGVGEDLLLEIYRELFSRGERPFEFVSSAA